MFVRTIYFSLVATLFVIAGFQATAQEPKKRSGTVVGEVKSLKNTPKDVNTIIEVLAPGEEKARAYFVNYDPKIKGPIPSVLKAVRAAKVGERVQLDWVDTNHGPAIQAFQVLTKGAGADKK